jgi:hypothetical protein
MVAINTVSQESESQEHPSTHHLVYKAALWVDAQYLLFVALSVKTNA